jgi:hypothetical protein
MLTNKLYFLQPEPPSPRNTVHNKAQENCYFLPKKKTFKFYYSEKILTINCRETFKKFAIDCLYSTVLSSAGHLRNWKILQIYQNFILDNKNKLYKLQKKKTAKKGNNERL